jgi:ABC-type proline/glycine betaine transport system substrate-binding protein
MKKLLLIFTVLLVGVSLAACQYESNTIVIGEGDWQSNQFYNQVAKIIIEEGYGVEVEVMQVDTPLLIASLTDGSIDLNLETWSDNMPTYENDIETGNYQELGLNFNDNFQGIYIPTYLADQYDIEYITDLVDHKALFPDPEVTNWDPATDKAVVYGGPSGWQVTAFLVNKFTNDEVYPELVEHFDFRPLESTALLDATLTDAYNSEEPWAGYNWEPTTIMGLFDMTLLKDQADYDKDTGAGMVPTNDVTVVASNNFVETHPEIAEFLENFRTSAQVASDALAYMAENELSAADTAAWWLANNKDMWTAWVPEDIVTKVEASL